MAKATKGKWINLDEMIDEVQRIGSEPDARVVGELSKVLIEAFEDTQLKVHSPGNPGGNTYIPTGSLLSSGKSSTDLTSGWEWSGEISYGETALLPHWHDWGKHGATGKPPHFDVEYAIYEMNRGGEHDFFRDLPLFDEKFLQALMTHFDNPKKVG